ncbi:unnamed protein product, partial [Rotaria sp. Silwood2]
MSLISIKDKIRQSFGISADSFEVQVYDECCSNNIVLDDEYLMKLHERLPRTFKIDLQGDILLNHLSS